MSNMGYQALGRPYRGQPSSSPKEPRPPQNAPLGISESRRGIGRRYASAHHPSSRHLSALPAGLLSASSGLMQLSKLLFYSITSSERANSCVGISSPIAFAVFRLIISLNSVGR